MRCQNCGHENPAEAKFCGKCATPTQSATAPEASTAAAPAASGGEVSQGLKVGIIIATVFIPLLGIIMGFIFLGDANPAKKAVGKTWLKVGVGVMIVYFIFWLLNHA